MAKILVIDDDLGLLQLMEDLLSIDKHEVETTHSGVKGWEKMQSGKYDLVVLDWDMPDANGIEILKNFRKAGGTTPILLMTGRNTGDDMALGLDTGADDYLAKPCNVKEFLARVRAALRKHQASLQSMQALGSGNQDLLSKANLLGTSLAARYEFMEVIGSGGVGTVFKARHPQLQRFVAIKMLMLSGLWQEAKARFEQEARLLTMLEHPAIGAIYDYGVTEREQPYMVMELIDGTSLDAILQQYASLSWTVTLEIATQVCDAMKHAHGKGILHRDLKPGNLMLTGTGEPPRAVKVLDFGCGKLMELKSEEGTFLTQDGRLFGSPPYMSPEQVRGKPVDERSDVYSLGCIIYEMLAGCPPFQGKNQAEIMFKHIEEDITPLRKVMTDSLPPELDSAILRALEKSPADRWQSMSEFKAALEHLDLTI